MLTQEHMVSVGLLSAVDATDGQSDPTEAHLALTSILTGLLLILHITHFFFSQPQFLADFEIWVSVQ